VSDTPTLSLASTSSHTATPSDRIEVTLGETVGRYQVRRLLGRGGMGQVYLARDVVLGRSVALKIVGPNRSVALSTERFLDEARAIARLNHPHVVQLYDFGEYKGGLYLALEYIDGDTLRERARHAPLGLDEVLRHARAIADGLAHAHDKGVYHCDLKPSNVMIGRDGRVRVVDFGIARTGETTTSTSSGTPDWMAPEQWTGAPATDRVDSWALGIVTAQLLTGQHPLGDPEQRIAAARDPGRISAWQPADRDVPAAVVDLINRALEYTPSKRPTASEWARVLDTVITDGRSDAAIEDGPYRGLAAFDEKHARYYFGRELEIDAFLERLRATLYLPIVGPSGAGKSSFLHAGVIPRLRRREPWTVIGFRPGADPVGALAHHVLTASRDDRRTEPGPTDLQHKAQVQAFRAELLETPTLLAARLATIAAVASGSVLLAVDQLEEAFTQGAPEAEREGFLRMLLAAVDDPLDPVRVVVTVRDDFVGKLAGLRSLFVVKRLSVEDIRRTITSPLARYNYELDDPTIIDDLVAEVGNTEAGNLPLLQFACRTLWDGRDPARRRLLRSTYRDMGGLAGALARHADHALSELSPDERRTARQLLLQLVVGTTRRSVARDQLIASARPDAAGVLDRLLAARLLVQRGTVDGEAPIVEIAHESLVHTWSQLARWLDESREERHLLDDLQDGASRWERRGRRPEDTWPPSELDAAHHRAEQLAITLPAQLAAFVEAGERRHRQARRRRRIAIGIALAALIAIAVPVLMFAGKLRSQEDLISSNTGTVDFVVTMFDWQAGAPVAVPADQMPRLSVALYGTDADDANRPGEPLPSHVVHVPPPVVREGQWHERISAPGGTLYLRFDGRGRAGERCSASWLRVLAFPGYRKDSIERIALRVPTCQATRADMIAIEPGPFWYGGPGEPASRHYGEPDYTEPERVVDLAGFAVDRTEVSNSQFATLRELARVTGYPGPTYSREPNHAHDGDPTWPVSGVDPYESEAYCAFMGKQLPSDFQWTKAARGGLTIGGRPNPAPKRLYPWIGGARPACVNDLRQDGLSWLASVESSACGASPYGVLNLVGNVQEWLSRDGQTDRENPLRAMRGGASDSPADLDQTTTIFRNHRAPRRTDYTIGVRCVVTEDQP
jgi:formylglycine-generating enzyme required for sulfatase activity